MSNILRIDNIHSRLVTEDIALKKELWKRLRFREKNYYHSPAYRQKKWDGFRDFFTLKAGQFLTGLLPEVKYALQTWGINYQVVDRREPVKFLIDHVDETFLWSRDHERPSVLRDYQIDLTNQAIKNKRGVIEAKTGSGKTLVLCSLIKALPPKTITMVLVDQKELVYQNYEEICKFVNPDQVGMYFSDVKKPNYITVALVNSVPKLQEMYPKIQALFVDEIHAMMSKRCIDFYKQCPNASIRIGFSATPFKFDGKDEVQKFNVKGHIGGILKTKYGDGGKLTTGVLQERKILSVAHCTFFEINEPQRPYDIYQDAFTYGIAQNEYLNQNVAKLVKNLTGRTLIVVDRIEHGERLLNLIPDAFWLHGTKSKDYRKTTVNELKFNKGNFVAVAIDKIVNKGLNVFIHNLINCAGGKAAHNVLQRVGRGLRPADDKQDLLYYDFLFKNNPYLESHSEQRIKIIESEGHKVEVKEKFDI